MHSTLIAPGILAPRLDDPSWVVLDVRHDLAQPDSWGIAQYRAGHLPGATFVHLDRDLSAPKTGRNGRHPLPSPESAAALFGRLGIGTSTQVVVYDQGAGMFASRAWWMLRWLGHDAVALLDGGYDRWVREGRPTTTDVQARPARDFRVGKTLPIVTADGVLAGLRDASATLIDARVPERFRGEIEPMDPVAGHIPGARNRPYGRNVGPDGSFKDATTLKREFDDLLDGTSAERVVHQCGSGVTACHNVLAMAVAGYPITKLYPGSWSEWVADDTRPVATGP